MVSPAGAFSTVLAKNSYFSKSLHLLAFRLSNVWPPVCVRLNGVKFFRGIHNAPVFVGAHVSHAHGSGIRFKQLSVDIKTLFVFREGRDEIRFGLLKGLKIDDLVIRRTEFLSGFRQEWGCAAPGNNVGEDHSWIGIAVRACVYAEAAERGVRA